jgi:hypothetical protein
MRLAHLAIPPLALLCVCAVGATAAEAQVARVFVAAQGSDANACTFAAPCRTFQHAHDTVAAHGEIDALDPAGYGSLTVQRSISIQGHGFAGISATSGNAITVNINQVGVVNVRGLLLDGAGSGQNGIQFDLAASVNIQDSLIRGFANGIVVNHADGALAVSNTTISDNSANGIIMKSSGVFSGKIMRAALDQVRLHNNGFAGLNLFSDNPTLGAVEVIAIVTDSIATNNGTADSGAGFVAQSPTGIGIFLTLERCAVAYNKNLGIVALGGQSQVYVDRSVVFHNQGGGWLGTSNGFVFSTGNNLVLDNSGHEDGQASIPLK